MLSPSKRLFKKKIFFPAFSFFNYLEASIDASIDASIVARLENKKQSCMKSYTHPIF